ncbi:MAG: hypothetical protein O9267_04305 [Flavobacterium sp.]|uniref:hypothetical protein n=1 Tax=Flavobacterium sp. TaxID=239 RepID=UPI0022C05F2E|nr:hypothetical protein [Flavobacterium sp.]MCZ8196808.1 hypothetical protein [Flavobacterium sp.]
MELNRIEKLLENYFQGETNLADEQELKNYFASGNVAPNLKQYQSVFGYFSEAKNEKFTKEIVIQNKKKNTVWLSIAASVTILLGVGVFSYLNMETKNKTTGELGTYDDPEVAFRETQKALNMVSENVNVGIKSVEYVNEYQESKNLIFK